MLITIVTTWFPSPNHPNQAPFTVKDARAIAGIPDAQVRLIHLLPERDIPAAQRRTFLDDIPVLRIPFDPRDPRSWAKTLPELKAAIAGSDIVHSMAISSLIPLALCGVDSPWVHTEHWSALTTPESVGNPLFTRMVPVFRKLERFPDIVTAVCDFLARPLREERGTKPVAVVPCIVNPLPVSSSPRPAHKQLRLFSTGGLVDRKDPLLAIRTVALLREQGVDAYLDWLGDGPLKQDCEALISELGLGEYVTLRGFISPDEVMPILQAEADMFFGPTKADNFFVSAAESILAGLPVVVGATGGQSEYISPLIGELIPVQDPQAYADAIIAVHERTKNLSPAEIAATIGDRFSAKNVGEGYANVYRELL